MTIVPTAGVSSDRVHTKPLKQALPHEDDDVNPVLRTSHFALAATNLVQIDEEGVTAAASYVSKQLEKQAYTPRTWRTHPLHLCPPEPYNADDPQTVACLDWIFLISSLNFSFWSEKEEHAGRYGVDWRVGWSTEERTVHTGYWALVAAIDKALEAGIPFTDPSFYASESRCPDSLIADIFEPAPGCSERMSLLKERVAILRENGSILCSRFGGSFQGFYKAFYERYQGQGTALQFVKMVTETFPTFRDETFYNGRRLYLWKRAQILTAETWAAFYPPSSSMPHPLFPGPRGAAIHELTMFADYRVPQILHHLRILVYPPELLAILHEHTMLAPGSREEISIRTASIVAVERVRTRMVQMGAAGSGGEDVSSVLIDFYLWDLAKEVESGETTIEGVKTAEIVPAHRTRSIWY